MDRRASVLRRGRPDLLRSLVDQGSEYLTRDQNDMASARAALSELEGDYLTAAARYEDAAARWGTFPSVFEDGLARMGAGRCLLAQRLPNEGAAHLREARKRFLTLRAAPLLAEVDDLLARATSKTS